VTRRRSLGLGIEILEIRCVLTGDDGGGEITPEALAALAAYHVAVDAADAAYVSTMQTELAA
jgi:hypothetical protein